MKKKGTPANSTYPQWLDFLGFTFVFHEQNFILAERTLLAFPPLSGSCKTLYATLKPKMRKIIILHFTLLLFVLSCNQKNNTNENSEIEKSKVNDTIDYINKIVLEIPEVAERAKFIEKTTNGKRHLSIQILKKSDSKSGKYYLVKVGESNEFSFVTHLIFYVYSRNLEIKYYNSLTDSTLSIEDWRKEKSGI